MVYTAHQLARLAGVSVRTLHHYDHVGLLKPASRGSNGYRQYGEKEAVLLQQILFFRELGFSLAETRAIVSRPDFCVQEALESHRTMLEKKAEHIAGLLATVDRTIRHLEGEMDMKISEYYEGLSDDQIEEYRKEARQRWGDDVVNESESRVMHMGKDGFAAQQAKGEDIFKAMAALMPKGPASPEVQEQVRLWREWLECFSSYSDEAVLGLGRMYSEDPRFAAFFAKYHPDLPAFLSQAVACHFAGTAEPPRTD